MKVLLLNGSPRKNGNTAYAFEILNQELSKMNDVDFEVIDTTRLNISGCIACDGCKRNTGNCVMTDDTNVVLDKIAASDILIFGTPVYWWGVSAQLKTVIDKFYARDTFHDMKKKIGIVSIGASDTSDKQYELIDSQFQCICDFLGWEKKMSLSFSACEAGDLKNNPNAKLQLEEALKNMF